MEFAVRHRVSTSQHGSPYTPNPPTHRRSSSSSAWRWKTLPRMGFMFTLLAGTWCASQLQLSSYRDEPDLAAISSFLAMQGADSGTLSNRQRLERSELAASSDHRALGGDSLLSQPSSITSTAPRKRITVSSSEELGESSLAITFSKVANRSTFSVPYRINPHFGGLNKRDIKEFRRRISKDDAARFEKERRKFLKDMDEYISSTLLPDDELEYPRECERATWQSKIFPTCNTVHEIERIGKYDKFLGSGFYRDAWLIQPSGTQVVNAHFVLKQMQMPNNRKDRYHRPNARSFAKIQKEAIIMERLTASPRIVSAYGHCGLSILSEPMSEEVSPLIIPNTGYAKQSELDKLPDVQPANNLTAFEKLDMALDMAKSIADIHGHPGLIVHGDIHPVQWLFSNRRQLKLNDFNNADILQWSRSENDYCKVDRGSWGGMYRSPEEFEGELADEKIDVYSMGNTIYVLLTGYWPFYEDKSYSVVQGKVMNATRPFVDDRYRHRSFIEGQMVEIMERMWEHDPADRPSIFEVIAFLTNVRAKVFRNGERKNTADPEDFVTVQQELVWDHSF